MHHQPGGLIISVECALAVNQPGFAKAPGGLDDQLARCIGSFGASLRNIQLLFKINYL